MKRLKLMFEINGKNFGINEKLHIIPELSENHIEKLENTKLAIKVS